MLSSTALGQPRDAGSSQLSIISSSAWLWTIVALGALLRLIALGHKSLWLDEIASISIASLPRPAFWRMLWHEEGNMALYYVLLRPWLHFGISETSVRLLSAVPGLLSIPAMYALGRRLFGQATALLAAALLAINACAVMSSQEARGYSLLVFGVILSTYAFVRLVDEPGYAVAIGYGVAAGLTFYCHYFGLLVPVAHGISLLALPREKRPYPQLAVAALVLAAFAAPVLWMIHIQDVGHLAWVSQPSLLEFYHLGAYLAAGSGKSVGGFLLALDLLLMALFLRRFATQWQTRAHGLDFWRYALVVSSLLAPVVLTLLASLVRPVFHHRFLIVCLPAWVLMTAADASEIRRTKWRVVAVGGVCVLSLASVILSYTRAQEDWRGAVQYLISQAGPQDRVLYYRSAGYFAAEHYRDWLPGGHSSRPQGVVVDPGNEQWKEQANQAARVWLVLYHAQPGDTESRALDAQLRQRFAVEREVPFRRITVIEYRARP